MIDETVQEFVWRLESASTLPAPPPIKTCSCGREFASDEWARLPLVGTMPDGEGNYLYLKNCPAPCQSTLALEHAS